MLHNDKWQYWSIQSYTVCLNQTFIFNKKSKMNKNDSELHVSLSKSPDFVIKLLIMIANVTQTRFPSCEFDRSGYMFVTVGNIKHQSSVHCSFIEKMLSKDSY